MYSRRQLLFSCFKLNSTHLLSQGKKNQTLPTHRLMRMVFLGALSIIVRRTSSCLLLPSKSYPQKIPLKGWKLHGFHRCLETSDNNRVNHSKEVFPVCQLAKKSLSAWLLAFEYCSNFIIPGRQHIWLHEKKGFVEIVSAWNDFLPSTERLERCFQVCACKILHASSCIKLHL